MRTDAMRIGKEYVLSQQHRRQAAAEKQHSDHSVQLTAVKAGTHHRVQGNHLEVAEKEARVKVDTLHEQRSWHSLPATVIFEDAASYIIGFIVMFLVAAALVQGIAWLVGYELMSADVMDSEAEEEVDEVPAEGRVSTVGTLPLPTKPASTSLPMQCAPTELRGSVTVRKMHIPTVPPMAAFASMASMASMASAMTSAESIAQSASEDAIESAPQGTDGAGGKEHADGITKGSRTEPKSERHPKFEDEDENFHASASVSSTTSVGGHERDIDKLFRGAGAELKMKFANSHSLGEKDRAEVKMKFANLQSLLEKDRSEVDQTRTE